MNPDDEISRLLSTRRGPSKKKMEEELRRAVINTGGVAVAKPAKAAATEPVAPTPEPAPLPTADDIARAVIYAAREFGVNPIFVVKALKNNDPGDGLPIKRARVIAAFALAEAFPDMSRLSIGRVLGATTKNWYRNAELRFMQNRPWPPGAIERVVRAIREHSK